MENVPKRRRISCARSARFQLCRGLLCARRSSIVVNTSLPRPNANGFLGPLSLQKFHRQRNLSSSEHCSLVACALAYVKRVFERYWQAELDLEDERAIRALLTAIKAPVSGFEAFARGDGRAELARIESELRQAGVFDVPTYLLSDDIFLGRQHLPLVRALLCG